MPATDEILEALDLQRAEPGVGFLHALFDRFNARVPFETATKILRFARVSDPEERPRRPQLFWKEHLEQGAGGTCFARVAALGQLLSELGFPVQRVLGRVLRDFDHAALAVTDRGRLWLCDVGFPLPAPVPAAQGRIETALGALAIVKSARGFRVDFSDGVPEGPRSLEIFSEPASQEEFDSAWRATFHPDSRFLESVALRRQSADRVVSFSRGEIRVDDRHSRLAVPITESRTAQVAEIFQIHGDLLDEAFKIVGDPEPEHANARLTAYYPAAASAPEAFAAIASISGYRRLLEGVAQIQSQERTPTGWRFGLTPPSEGAGPGGRFVEEVTADLDVRQLTVRRASESGVRETFLRAAAHEGQTYLVSESALDGPRRDLLRNDSLRGRLAGALAADLLAWARQIAARGTNEA